VELFTHADSRVKSENDRFVQVPFKKMEPQSCDTFAVLSDLTGDGSVVFGKNSDRPRGEVQEVIYSPPRLDERPIQVRNAIMEEM